jgi:hypothetical protein
MPDDPGRPGEVAFATAWIDRATPTIAQLRRNIPTSARATA